MPNYTENDLKAHQDLMVFDGRGSDAGPKAEDRQSALAINYAKSDVSQFDELMKFGISSGREAADQNRWERQPGASRAPVPERLGAGPTLDGTAYAAADLRQFDRLLSPLHGDSVSLFAAKFDEVDASLVNNGQSYTAQDLDAFRHLMEFSRDMAAEPSAPRAPRAEPLYVRTPLCDVPTRPMRMKIVDADKEREQERNNRQSGKIAIKIVYSSSGGGIS